MSTSRAGGLVQPGVLKFHGAILIRTGEKGWNVGILVLTDEGERRSFLVKARAFPQGSVALEEVTA